MHDHQIVQMLRDVLTNQQRLLNGQSHLHDQEKRIMATLTDISTALANLSSNISSGFQVLTTDLTTLLTDLGASSTQIQAIVDSITQLGSGFQGDVTVLDSAIKAADPGTTQPA